MRGLPKLHWVDAACRGTSTPMQLDLLGVCPWLIGATGRQKREIVNLDEHGFPRGRAKGKGCVQGFRTGDLVRAIVTKGKKSGTYVGCVGIKTDGYFKFTGAHGMVEGIHARYCSPIHRNDGYRYTKGGAFSLYMNAGPLHSLYSEAGFLTTTRSFDLITPNFR